MVTIYNRGTVVCMGEPSHKDTEFVAAIYHAVEQAKKGGQ